MLHLFLDGFTIASDLAPGMVTAYAGVENE